MRRADGSLKSPQGPQRMERVDGPAGTSHIRVGVLATPQFETRAPVTLLEVEFNRRRD